MDSWPFPSRATNVVRTASNGLDEALTLGQHLSNVHSVFREMHYIVAHAVCNGEEATFVVVGG